MTSARPIRRPWRYRARLAARDQPTFARRRRCAHHGTAKITAPIPGLRKRRHGKGRPRSRPKSPRWPHNGDGRVYALDERGESPPRAEYGYRPGGHAGQYREGPTSAARCRAATWRSPPGHRHGQRARARNGTATPTARALRPRSRGRLPSVDHHHRLKAAPSRQTGLPAHPAVRGHLGLREALGTLSGAFSSSRRYHIGSGSPSACAASAARIAARRLARSSRVRSSSAESRATCAERATVSVSATSRSPHVR